MTTAAAPTKLTALLERTGLFTPEQTEALLARQQKEGGSFTASVVALGLGKEEGFLEKLAEAMEIGRAHV